MKCCRYVTIWSLHYLALLNEKSLLTMHNADFISKKDIRNRVVGCDRMSESLLVSLQLGEDVVSPNSQSKQTQRHSMSRKVVIVNEKKHGTFLIKLLNTNATNDATNKFFAYAQVNDAGQDKLGLNVYECVDLMADWMMSARNLVVITILFDDEPNEKRDKNNETNAAKSHSESAMQRVLPVMTKNILPCGILFLCISSRATNLTCYDEVKRHLTDSIQQLQEELR